MGVRIRSFNSARSNLIRFSRSIRFVRSFAPSILRYGAVATGRSEMLPQLVQSGVSLPPVIQMSK